MEQNNDAALHSRLSQLERQVRSGANFKRTTPVLPAVIGKGSMQHLRHHGSYNVDAHYVAGEATGGAFIAKSCSSNTIYAAPFFTGRGGTIDSILVKNGSGLGGGSLAALAFYGCTSEFDLYPKDLIAAFSEVDLTGVGVTEFAAYYECPPDEMWWLCYCGNATASLIAHDANDCIPIFGVSATFEARPGYGLKVANTYASPNPFPNEFPTGATVLRAAGANDFYPAMAVRYAGGQ